MPCWARRVVRVAPIIAKVKPEEIPRNRAASGADSKYARRPSGSLLRKSLSQRVVIVDRQGGMVREPLRLVDRLLHRLRGDAGRGDLVVDAPADVLRPRLAAVRPPGVLLRLGVEATEHVDEADLVEHLRKPVALLGQEAGVLPVGAPVPQVDLPVRDVPVAAQDDLGISFFQPFKLNYKILQEPDLRSLT